MAARKPTDLELRVGLFVTLGLALTMFAIVVLGGVNSVFSRQITYTTHVASTEGLIQGAKVVLGGLTVGVVDSLDFDPQSKDIKIGMKVNRKYQEWIRANSTVEIMTQGVLGDKFIAIASGSQDQPILEPNSELPYRPGKDLNQFLSKGDQLMVSLNSIASSLDRLLKSFEAGNRSEMFFQGMATTAKNLSAASVKLNTELEQLQLKNANAAVKNLNQILEKVNNGTGTLGALVNDPGLYYDAKSLMGGANRNRVIRNLVRKTIKDADEAEAEAKEAEKK